MQLCFVVISRMASRDKVGMPGYIVAGLASRTGIQQIPRPPEDVLEGEEEICPGRKLLVVVALG